MKNPFIGSLLIAAAILTAFCFMPAQSAAQDGGRAKAPEKGGPTPRLADGRPDLGNGKGVTPELSMTFRAQEAMPRRSR